MEQKRVTVNSSTCLDRFQNVPKSETCVLKNEEIADHYPTMLNWSIQTSLKSKSCLS